MARHFPARAATGHRSRATAISHKPRQRAMGRQPRAAVSRAWAAGPWAARHRWKSALMRKALPWQTGGMQGSANLPFDRTAEVSAHPWDTCFLQIFSLFTILNLPLVIFIIW